MTDDLKGKAFAWRKLLLSDDPEIRKNATEEMLSFTIANLSDQDLEQAIDRGRNILYDFQHNLKFDNTLLKFATKAETINILRKNWQTVSNLLNHPKDFRDKITDKGTKHLVLFSSKGGAWLNQNCLDLLRYMKILCYDYFCGACRRRISSDPDKPFIVKSRREILEKDPYGQVIRWGKITGEEYYCVPCGLPKAELLAEIKSRRKS